MKVKKAVIPAAGLGTRMLPATKTIPKEMLPVVDKPAIQYIVEEAVNSGVEDVLILTNRSKTVMEDYFDYSPELEDKLRMSGRAADADMIRSMADMANITFIRQKQTLGLGHAVWCAKSFVGNEPFAVLLGDDIMHAQKPVIAQLIDAATKYDCAAVGVKHVSLDVIGKYCTLDVEALEEHIFRVRHMIEKPRPEQILSDIAILGRYVLTPTIFDILGALPPGFNDEIQLTDGLARLCAAEPMVAVEFEGRRFDTGSLTGYLETVIEFALEHPKAGAWMRNFISERSKTL